MNPRPKTKVTFACYFGLSWSKNREEEFWAQARKAGATGLFETRHMGLGVITKPFGIEPEALELDADAIVIEAHRERFVREALKSAGNKRTTVIIHDENEAKRNPRDENKQLLQQVAQALKIDLNNKKKEERT